MGFFQLREDCTAAEWNDVADATSHRQRIPQEGFFVIGKFEKRRKGILCGKWENAVVGGLFTTGLLQVRRIFLYREETFGSARRGRKDNRICKCKFLSEYSHRQRDRV